MKSHVHGTAKTLSLLSALVTTCISIHAQTPKIPMGMDLGTSSYWDEQLAFSNLMQNASPWSTADAGFGEKTDLRDRLETDANGYPLQVPSPVAGYADQEVECQLPRNYPPGRYVVTYEGTGELHFWNVSVVSAEPQNNRYVIDMQMQGNHSAMWIIRSELGDHVRDIRILPEADEGKDVYAEPFFQPFLDALEPFQCIRYMGFMLINSNHIEHWEDRVLPTSYCQQNDVSIEYCIQLSNTLGCDGWFCIPAQADTNYIRQYARLVRDQMNPELTVYLEYTNEHWNWAPGFDQFHWIRNNEWAQATYGAQYGWTHGENVSGKYAALSSRAFEIWLEEFGPEHRDRLVRVAAGFHFNPGVANEVLGFLFDGNGGCDAWTAGGY
ncbi:MAG: hypothetical protein GF331_12610, partial [Chitinivibrionales bacterium]|nr:hypothetical protein [Chitinivibrionales bacterium]